MHDSKPSPPALALRVATRTDVGMRRATNQDSLAVSPAPNGEPITGDALLMVADGMGAHAAGELASQIAAEAVPHAYLKAAGESAPDALGNAILEANEAIHSKGNSSPEFTGMGTTCSCLVATHGAAVVGHVGDSRVYRLRDGVLEQLTRDHSLVWEMAEASQVSAEKVPSCIPKNVITRSLGPHETVQVDLEGPHQLAAGDVFLLCSDGLTGVVDDPLAGGVLGAMSPAEAAVTLIDLANLRGGPDNITVVIAEVEGAASKSSRSPAPSPQEETGGWGLAVGIGSACALACGWFSMLGNVPGAVTSAVGLGVAIAYSIATKAPQQPKEQLTREMGGPHGKGPYRRTELGDLGSAAGDLRDLVRELSNLESDEDTVRTDDSTSLHVGPSPFPSGVMLNWKPFEDTHQEAEALFERGEFSAAIAAYASIIRNVMQTIREDDGTHRYQPGTGIIG